MQGKYVCWLVLPTSPSNIEVFSIHFQHPKQQKDTWVFIVTVVSWGFSTKSVASYSFLKKSWLKHQVSLWTKLAECTVSIDGTRNSVRNILWHMKYSLQEVKEPVIHRVVKSVEEASHTVCWGPTYLSAIDKHFSSFW